MTAKIDLSSSNISAFYDYFDLLIITATPTEKNEVHKYLHPIDGKEGILRIQKDQYTYYLGKFGHYNAVHVATGSMGMSSRTASIHTAMTAIGLWAPKAVLMVGIAFGVDPKKLRIGDVLLSERVVNYEPHRANPDGSKTQRGAEGPASTLLLDRYRSTEDWKYIVKYDNEEYAAKHAAGLLLSGEVLLDDPVLKAQLVTQYPNAIGGEMEGAGIYTACDGKVQHWIIAKAVCDFGDGTKNTDPNKDLYQELAIQSAVSLSHTVFSGPYSFEDIGLYSGAVPEAEATSVGEKKKLEQYLAEQLGRQLSRQIASQKYIPSTFIEVEDNKEMMRYFCAPLTFVPKILHELAVMDFTNLSEILSKTGQPKFEFDIWHYATTKNLNLENVGKFTEQLQSHLSQKIQELERPPVGPNDIRSYSHKVSNIRQQLKWFSSKVCLIKEDAGQGKTNFICDLIDNFISSRGIPSMFLLGSELVATDIRASILKKVFPDSPEVTFSSFLSELKKLCTSLRQPFILFIDGLNENARPDQLSKPLEDFISEITENTFIKIVLSCRSEYYKKHFSMFDKSAFAPFVVEIGQLRIHRNAVAAEKIFWAYMDFFGIQLDTYSDEVFEQLTGNFLLLRIFCDSHQGEHISHLGTIYKQALFRRYYTNKVEEINRRMDKDDELKVMGKIDIRRFLEKLIVFMIENDTYENIALDDILSANDNRKVYVRFLDENILVRRDPKPDASVFEDQELVNFTFDEFRDFLLADYLVTKIYPRDQGAFIKFLKEKINPSSRILEGCGTFLFFIARRTEDKNLNMLITQQAWYVDIFRKCIFDMEDELVTEEDRATIFAQLRYLGRPSRGVFYHFVSRTDFEHRPNLNLDHYLAFLRELDSQDFDRLFSDMFVAQSYHGMGQVELDNFLQPYDQYLDVENDSGSHRAFELLLYLFKCQRSWKVMQVYEKFFHRHVSIGRIQLKAALAANDRQLGSKIEQFCKRYDILL